MQRHAAKGTEGKEREMVLVSAWKDDHSTLIPGFGFVNIIVLVTIGALSSGGNIDSLHKDDLWRPVKEYAALRRLLIVVRLGAGDEMWRRQSGPKL